jgi:hypothetical protein
MDGILGLAVSQQQNIFHDRSLYFHALASGHENSVSLKIINNSSLWENDVNAMPRAFKTIGVRRIQTAAQAMDRNGNLFFVLLDPLAIACWDSSTQYNRDNIRIVYQNYQTLQFASGVKIVENLFDIEELWIVTNRFQVIFFFNLFV